MSVKIIAINGQVNSTDTKEVLLTSVDEITKLPRNGIEGTLETADTVTNKSCAIGSTAMVCTNTSTEEYILTPDNEWVKNYTNMVMNGVTITKIDVDDDGYLICIMSDNTVVTSENPIVGGSGDAILDEDITFMDNVGGIEAGTTFGTGTSLDEIFKQMASKYIAPSARLTSNLSTNIYELGTTVTGGLTLTATVVKGSATITKIEFYKDSTVVNTITQNAENGGEFSHTDENSISADTTYKVVVTDSEGKTVSATYKVSFYNPYYHGISAKTLDNITVTDVVGMTKDLSAKGKKTYSYTSNNEYCVVAYPKSYGTISSILDSNGFQNVDSWQYVEVEINGVVYYVYQTKTPVICTAFAYILEY